MTTRCHGSVATNVARESSCMLHRYLTMTSCLQQPTAAAFVKAVISRRSHDVLAPFRYSQPGPVSTLPPLTPSST